MLIKILKINTFIIGMIYIGAAVYLQITHQINVFESIACYAMGALFITFVWVFDLWNQVDDIKKQIQK